MISEQLSSPDGKGMGESEAVCAALHPVLLAPRAARPACCPPRVLSAPFAARIACSVSRVLSAPFAARIACSVSRVDAVACDTREPAALRRCFAASWLAVASSWV